MGRGVALSLVVAAVALAVAPSAAAGPLRTGFVEPYYYGDPAQQELAFDRSKQAGATVAKLVLEWRQVAPRTKPPGFNPRNHLSLGYDWSSMDRQVQLATARGLTPLITILHAPPWAEGAGGNGSGIFRPDPVEFGNFAYAAASRYAGVRLWQAWSEPNRDYFLMPQYENGRMVSATWYRTMVRHFADGVHGVSQANVVVAGGLAPLGRTGKPSPLAFMRSMLCLSKTLGRACDLRASKVPFDVWSHHPYTSGGPTHRAAGKDDVALGDLPDMRRVLRAAVRLGHVRSDGRVGFWVTEFSWDTRPPDPQGLPSSLHARWTAEALYRMWQNGVTLVTWFRIMDDPMSSSYFQSGLFTVDGRPKLSLRAYRFPVVALTRTSGVYVWGRTPTSRGGRVVVELKSGRRWRRLGTLTANGSGIFQKTFRTPVRRGTVRARLGSGASVPFSLTYVRDRFVSPFGCGGSIPC